MEGRNRKSQLLRFNGALIRDPAIDSWMQRHPAALSEIAGEWFAVLRRCGDEVRELMHDGCPWTCLGDVPFAYVNVFQAHVNVGFVYGAALHDPARLLAGTGRLGRHVKLKPGAAISETALTHLIDAAWEDVRRRVEHG